MPAPFQREKKDIYWGIIYLENKSTLSIFFFVVVVFASRKIDFLPSPHNAAQLRNDKED